MTYVLSYVVCLMSHLMSDVICSHGFGLCLAFRIGDTRKCVPIEAARISSTSNSYLKVAQHYNSAQDSKLIFLCANNGIPQRTCSAVDSEVLKYLRRIHYRKLESQHTIQKGYGDCVVAPPIQGHVPSIVQATACFVRATRDRFVKDWQATASQVQIYCLRLVPPLGRAYRIYLLEPHFPRLITISA